jgi:hypothetical protein
MNLFILDEDFDRCAEAHIDVHIGKMQLEAAQLLSTSLWIDEVLGFVPRALNSEELQEVKARCKAEPAISERIFLRYLATHHNHPCAVWARSSLGNFAWAHCYINALNSENIWRGNKSHASCAEANRMPDPRHITGDHMTPFALAMPDEYKCANAVNAYRIYYNNDKASIASWKRRGPPDWWIGD